MNVKVFRLNSGEEILARFEMTDTHVILKDPAILIPVGEGQIGMMPWLIYTKASKGVQIPLTFIAFSIDPVDEMKAQYDASLNKGIVAPSTNINKGPSLKLTT